MRLPQTIEYEQATLSGALKRIQQYRNGLDNVRALFLAWESALDWFEREGVDISEAMVRQDRALAELRTGIAMLWHEINRDTYAEDWRTLRDFPTQDEYAAQDIRPALLKAGQ